jgi:hypothetical protein
MKKLEKRQIIILSIAALFVLYAIYDLLIVGSVAKKAKTAARPAEIETVVNTLSGDLMKYKAGGVDAYLAKRAETDWGNSPFWERESYRVFAGSREGGVTGVKFIYSGYVDTGREKIAIVNGVEYQPGEALEIEGYELKSVMPESVLIVNRRTGSQLSVPMQE